MTIAFGEMAGIRGAALQDGSVAREIPRPAGEDAGLRDDGILIFILLILFTALTF
jgi:hypothetical protein